MVAVVIITLVVGAAGAIVWASDKRHPTYGALLPSGAAVVTALITWMVTVAAGLDDNATTAWIPWILSIVVGTIFAVATAQLLGRNRHHEDLAKVTSILQMR